MSVCLLFQPGGALQQTIQVSQPPSQVSMAVRQGPVSTMTVTRPQVTPHTTPSVPRPGLRAPAPVRPPTAAPRPQTMVPRPGVTPASVAPGRMGFPARHSTPISGARVPNLPSGPRGVSHQGPPHMGPPVIGHPHMGLRTAGSPHMRPTTTGSPHMGLPSSGSPHMGLHRGGSSPHMGPLPPGSPHTRPPLPGSPHTPLGSPLGVPGSPLGSPTLVDQHMHQSRGHSPGGLRPTSPAAHSLRPVNGPAFQLGGPRNCSPTQPLAGPSPSPGFCLNLSFIDTPPITHPNVQ